MRNIPSTLGKTLQATLNIFSLAAASPKTANFTSQSPALVNWTTAEAGNPFVDGWYADPDTAIYDGLYWVYPTASLRYEEQTYLDAFSSPDLIHWTKYPNVLTIANITWAKKAVWAPAPAYKNGKYYLYFGANDIQEGEPEKGLIGGIGVAVADRPQGPYVDAIGKPLIGTYNNSAQPIDQDVFIDDDGQAYIYYGGHGHANVARLNEDMVSVGTFPDSTTFKEITPQNYVEGPQMLKRNGKYYLMWSEGGWTGPDYAVSYAMADSPLGPFPTGTKILQQDSAVARGSGHNGVINVPGTDIYYIVYHRRPLSETDGNHRVLAYDRMYFNDDGTIKPVRMLVKDNFADGNMISWKTYGVSNTTGAVHVVNDKLEVQSTTEHGVVAALDTNFTDQVFDATVYLPVNSTNAMYSAGLLFRATNLNLGLSNFSGYYAGFSAAGHVLFSKYAAGVMNTTVYITNERVRAGVELHVRVSAVGQAVSIFVENFAMPALAVTDTDSTYTHGTNGVAVFGGVARFGNVAIDEKSAG